MGKFKNYIKGNYTILPNEVINDKRLSWKAKGIFAFLVSKPDTWNFYMEEIKTNSTDGITALRSGIKELIELDYLIREDVFNDEGDFAGKKWTLKLPGQSALHPQMDKIDSVIKYWNNLKRTTSHKINHKEPSKKYQRLVEWIGNMIEGKPFLHNKDGSLPKDLKSFCENNTISESLLYKKYSPSEIKQVLSKALEVFKKHSDKNADLEQIIWSPFANNRQGWSHFLEVIAKKKIPKQYERLAHELGKLSSTFTPAKRKAWARKFQQFTSTEFNGTAKDIYTLIKWYQENYKDQYVPKAKNAEEFCDKYDDIIAAKERKNSPTNGKPKPAAGYNEPDHEFQQEEDPV